MKSVSPNTARILALSTLEEKDRFIEILISEGYTRDDILRALDDYEQSYAASLGESMAESMATRAIEGISARFSDMFYPYIANNKFDNFDIFVENVVNRFKGKLIEFLNNFKGAENAGERGD